MAINTDALIKVAVPKPQIVPVGITPAVVVDGKISTQTQGRGEGLFADIVSGASILYNTFKTSSGTVGSVPLPGVVAGSKVGTGNFKTTFEDDGSQNSENSNWLWLLIGGFFIFKFLK